MFGKPERVKKAIYSGDTNYLRNAARKGAQVANENRTAQKAEAESIAEAEAWKREIEAEERRLEANEHILTPDGFVPEYDDSDDLPHRPG